MCHIGQMLIVEQSMAVAAALAKFHAWLSSQVFGRVWLASPMGRLERRVLAQIFTYAHDGWKLVKVHFESIEKKSF